MSITSEIQRIQQAKEDIKTSLQALGCPIPSSATVDEYASYIDCIEGFYFDSIYPITYSATRKLSEIKTVGSGSGLHINSFYGVKGKLTIISHTFENGIGTIMFNANVIDIGDYAFQSCTYLTSINIPNSVKSINSNAFSNCRGLTSIDIPNSVTTIGDYVFYNCSGLTSVTIGSGVTSIGNYAFQNCSGLTSINIPSGVTTIGNNAFQSCTSLTSINIPNSVTTIGTSAFTQCAILSVVIIGSGVTTIGDYAFQGCSSLTSITSNATIAPTITKYTFQSVGTYGTLYVPIGSSGYDVWMGTSSYDSGLYYWAKVEE